MTVVAARFSLEGAPIVGGFGRVQRARDRDTGALVALKVLERPRPADEERLLREGAALERLRHPGIVGHVAHGRDAEGRVFLAMEWLEGEDLATRIARGPLPPFDAARVALGVARALEAAHRMGVVHRDIKPSNVFLVNGSPDDVRVLDFGVARDTYQGKITHTGDILGTPEYVAPEQARADVELDGRADLFSLGVLLYEALTGVCPFAADSAVASLAKVILHDPPPADSVRPGVPQALALLAGQLVEKERARRPKDAGEAALLLEDAIAFHEHSRDTLPHAPSITPGEERVLCVVMAAPRPDAPPESTMTPRAIDEAERRLRESVSSLGGILQPLGQNGLVASIAFIGTVQEHAVRAAECALAVRMARPQAAVAVAFGRGRVQGALPAGAVIDAGSALLARGLEDDGGPIALDGRLAEWLEERFELRRDADAVWLVGRRASARPGRTFLGKETPCVGREPELSTLEAQARSAVEEPGARLALVLGDAGSGKSRVRYELLRRLADGDAAPRVLELRGDPLTPGAPFSMLAAGIRREAQIAPGEDLDASRAKLRAWATRVVPTEGAEEVTVFLAELAGVPFDARDRPALAVARADAIALGDRMYAALEAVIAAILAEGPVCLVLEDLHWGDVPTVRFVEALVRALPDAPLFVLGLGRPEVERELPGLFALPGACVIRLGPLRKKACLDLARAALGARYDEAIASDLFARCEGNALYLEELLRAVAEGKRGELPETVLAMMHARLDVFGPRARRALRAASVFGSRAWRGGIARLLGDDAHDLPQILDDLVRREVLSRSADALFPGEAEYAFRHALLRDAAYSMLPEADRRLGHELAAAWLAERGETSPLVLAEHYERAGLPERAASLYAEGAAQALEGDDSAGATERARRGLACAPADDVRGALLLTLAEASSLGGDQAACHDAAAEALRLLAPGTAAYFRAQAAFLYTACHLGALNLAEAAARSVLATRAEDDEARAARVVCTCRGAVEMGNAGRAIAAELYESIDEMVPAQAEIDLTLARTEDLLAPGSPLAQPGVVAWVHWARGWRALQHSDPAGFLRGARAARACFEAARDLRRTARSLVDLGYGHAQLGEYEAAERFYREAIAVSERRGLAFTVGATWHNLGPVLARLGRLDEAVAAEKGALEVPAFAGNARLRAGAHVYLAELACEAGEHAQAAHEVEAALAIAPDVLPIRAMALSVKAQALLAQGRPSDALSVAREAMDLLHRLGGLEEGEVRLRLVWAQALAETGAGARAKDELREARDLLLARAAAISDDALRTTFLARVPENARVLELAGRA